MSLIKDLLANAGGTTAAFTRDTPAGYAVQGVITSADVRQTTDFDTGKPEFWDDGTEKQQLVIVIQTDQRNSADDDGKRAIYIKWWGDQRLNLIKAVEKAQDDDVRVGGQFWAKYVGTKPNEKNPRLNDIKVYEYAYQKPANTAGLDMNAAQQPGQAPQQQQAPVQQQQAPAQQAQPDPWANQPVQQQAPVVSQEQAAAAAFQQGLQAQPVQQQAPAQAAPATAPGVDVARVQQFLGMGLSDAEVAGATGVSLDHVAAIRAAG